MRAKKNSNIDRVLRGGCFGLDSRFLPVSYRDGDGPVYQDRFSGFRLVIRKKS